MRQGQRQKGIGWRLDYFVVSKRFVRNVQESFIRAEAYGASDHGTNNYKDHVLSVFFFFQ